MQKERERWGRGQLSPTARNSTASDRPANRPVAYSERRVASPRATRWHAAIDLRAATAAAKFIVLMRVESSPTQHQLSAAIYCLLTSVSPSGPIANLYTVYETSAFCHYAP